MKTLALELEDRRGVRPLEFSTTSMINLGYVGRDEAAVRHHIEELAKEGVPPPSAVPLVIPMPLNALCTDTQIDVAQEKTSGEVELVFLNQRGKIYVGVGSDHTDRELERSNIALSKQVCPNVLGARVWDLDELKDGWDDLLLQSWVGSESGEILYQSAPLKTMLPAQRLLDCAFSILMTNSKEGLVIFSGTISLIHSQFIYAPSFRCELFNPASGRRLSCQYTVRVLSSVFSVS